jgi:hypothetical protein
MIKFVLIFYFWCIFHRCYFAVIICYFEESLTVFSVCFSCAVCVPFFFFVCLFSSLVFVFTLVFQCLVIKIRIISITFC